MKNLNQMKIQFKHTEEKDRKSLAQRKTPKRRKRGQEELKILCMQPKTLKVYGSIIKSKDSLLIIE